MYTILILGKFYNFIKYIYNKLNFKIIHSMMVVIINVFLIKIEANWKHNCYN